MKHYQAPPQLLNECVILVTGAGQGIGKAVAKAYAAHGATVILLGRQQAKLEATYDEIVAANHPEPLIFPLDLAKSSEQDYINMAEGIHQQLGRLDGIAHIATQFDNLSPLEIQTEKQFDMMFKINVTAPFLITKACLPLLKRAPDASVIFTSTTAAQQPSAYWGAHAISKAAADHMMKTWSEETESVTHIRFNSVVPGALQSPQRKKTHPGEMHSNLPQVDSLLPVYLYLMGMDSKDTKGVIIA